MSSALPPLPSPLLDLLAVEHPAAVEAYRDAHGLRSAPAQADAPTANVAQAEQPQQERARKRAKK